jgi:single-strand DNA-binding protein
VVEVTQQTSRVEPVEPDGPAEHLSSVVLAGKVTAGPDERVLPSGDRVVSFRVSVPRRPTPLGKGSRQRADWIDCVTASARCRRSVLRWSVGDVVEVEGVLRRRFLRAAGFAGSTRLEVEMLAGRRLR